MLAAVTTHHGGLEAIELRYVALPRPGAGEVLVEVLAARCNNTDLWTREGSYGSGSGPDAKAGWLGPLDFPRIQGGDVAGTVVAVGDAAEGGFVGTRVLVDPALYDDEAPDAHPIDVLGSERDGGFAQYVVVPGERAHPVDGSPLSDEQLAALPIAYGTALGMLERGGVTPGHTVVVTGASGGVGLAAVQLARARGARVVAVCSEREGRRGPRGRSGPRRGPRPGKSRCGPGAGRTPGIRRRHRRRRRSHAGRGLGPGAPRWSLGGGWRAGRLGRAARRTTPLPRQHRTGGVDDAHAADLRPLGGPRTRGSIRPVIAATFALTDVAEAQRELARRAHVGKIVVVP